MTRYSRLAASLLVALALGASLAGAQAAPKTVPLTILHTNDTHGHLLPFSYADATAASDRQMQGMPAHRDIGGIARRATLPATTVLRVACRESAMPAGRRSNAGPTLLLLKATVSWITGSRLK